MHKLILNNCNDVTNIEPILRVRCGLVLFKPDSVRLDIVEYLLNYISEKHNLSIGVVKIVSPTQDELEKIQPNLDEIDLIPTIEYMRSGPMVLASYHTKESSNTRDIWHLLKIAKGSTMWNWTTEDLNNRPGLEKFIRGIIPVPGTKKDYLSVIEKIKSKAWFTPEEFYIYIQNIIHTATNLEEFTPLLDLLNKKEKEFFFKESQIYFRP